jgi:carboxynorspermidine decarboxylase
MSQLPVETPAFIYDEAVIDAACTRVARLAHANDCKLLFSVKALALAGVLEIVGRHVDGFSTSSPFESRLVSSVIGSTAVIHTTCPGLREQDLASVGRTSNYLSFNSESQLRLFGHRIDKGVQLGIRANPGLSLVSDARYDPCRPYSKLGAPLHEVAALFRTAPVGSRLNGLHVHNNCDSETFDGLLRTVRHLDESIEEVLKSIAWINLGGGYTFPSEASLVEFAEAIGLLRSKYDVEVFIEPGAALVRSGVQLVSTIVDLFERDQRTIAVLDTGVNHVPEVFEYCDIADSEPWVLGQVDHGPYSYLLAGCTCLAGDVLGWYSFDHPLRIGDQVVILDIGAYAFSKAHWFNGINLPSVYARSGSENMILKQRFTFEDFARRNAVSKDRHICG